MSASAKTVEQVAERGRGELASRFGNGFVSLLERKLGRYGTITPRLPLADLIAERRFADGTTACGKVKH